MASIEQLESALVKADAAGDTEGARILAGEVRKIRSSTKPSAAQQVANDEITKGAQSVEATIPELIAANPIVRTLTAAAKPVFGAASLIEGLWGGTSNQERINQLDAMQKRGAEALNIGGASTLSSDVVGSILSPIGLGATKIAPAASYIGKVAQGAGIGAVAGATSGSNTPIADTAQGAAVGGAIPAIGIPVAKTLKGGYNALIEPWLNPAAIKGRAFLEAAGDKADDIIAFLRQNKEIVPGSAPTAGEAAVPAGRAEFAALQKSASNVRPSDYLARTDEQNAARIAALRTVGQDKAALDAAIAERGANAEEAYGAVRGIKVNPASDVQIMEAAIAGKAASKGEALRDWGRFSTTQAQSTNKNLVGQPGWLSHGDRAVEAGSAAADALAIAQTRRLQESYLENAMESLKSTVGLDNKSLNEFLARPSMRSAVRDALKSAQETGTYFPAAKGEQFSVANLQRVKESLDAGIAAAKKSAEAGKRPELSPVELEGTRRRFIDWLSNKVTGWKEARQQYAADSVPINQMQVGQYLEKKLVPSLSDEAKQKASTFATAVQEAPTTIRKATDNSARFEELSQVLNPRQIEAVKSVQDDLARTARFDEMAQKGAHAGPNAVDLATQSIERSTGGKVPNPLNRHVMVFNQILSRLEGKINKKLAAELAVEMLNPPGVAESMKQA